MHRFDLSGKVALVTGGNGGIGQGIACGLLECGAAVVIAGRNEQKNKDAVAELAKIGPPVSAVVLDVTSEEHCRVAVNEVVRQHGRLDILVNNAGIGAPGGPALPDDMPLASWQKVIDTNLTSAFVLSQLAYPEMKKVGGGKIINIGSMRAALDRLRSREGGHRAAQQELRFGLGQGQHSGELHLARPDRYGDDQVNAGQQGVHGARSSAHRRRTCRYPR